MFIYTKKIYLIIFLTLFSFNVFASTPGTVLARDVLFTSTPQTENNIESLEPKIEEPAIDPGDYFALAQPVIGCQATYSVQDRLLLDMMYTNNLFEMADPKGIQEQVGRYRAYLIGQFNELQDIIEELREMSLPKSQYPDGENRSNILMALAEQDLQTYSQVWNQLWITHAQNPPEQFMGTLSRFVQDCFGKQRFWKDKLDSLGSTL